MTFEPMIMSIKDQLQNYSEDEWIAVIDNKIVANGADVREVYAKSKLIHPSKRPFIMKVPASDKVVMLQTII